MLGVVLILVSTTAYNSAPVFLARAARARRRGAARDLLLGIAVSRSGLVGMACNAVGFACETLALTSLSLTLTRVLSAAGLIVLLVLAHWVLGEPLGRQEILGAGAVGLGITAVALDAPVGRSAPPGTLAWVCAVALLAPLVLWPIALDWAGHAAGPILNAVGAGTGYALSSLFDKGLASGLTHVDPTGIGLAALGVAIAGLLAFVDELRALRLDLAARVEPILRALMLVIPLAAAPRLFSERWPSGWLPTLALAGGILLTVAGSAILARSTSGVVSQANVSHPRAQRDPAP